MFRKWVIQDEIRAIRKRRDGPIGKRDGPRNWLCPKCNNLLENHTFLYEEEIEFAKKQGFDFGVCSGPNVGRTDRWGILLPLVPTLENPCDEDFMRKISS